MDAQPVNLQAALSSFDERSRRVHISAGGLAGHYFSASGGAVMATEESSKVVIQPELNRTQAKSLVFDAVTGVVPGQHISLSAEK
jgi:hypothetical protein